MSGFYSQIIGSVVSSAGSVPQNNPAQTQNHAVPATANQVSQVISQQARQQTGRAVEDKKRAIDSKRVESPFAGRSAKGTEKGTQATSAEQKAEPVPFNENGDFDIVA